MKVCWMVCVLVLVSASDLTGCWRAFKGAVDSDILRSVEDIEPLAESVVGECTEVIETLKSLDLPDSNTINNWINTVAIVPYAMQVFSVEATSYYGYAVANFFLNLYAVLTGTNSIEANDWIACNLNGANIITTIWSVNDKLNTPLYLVQAFLSYQTMLQTCPKNTNLDYYAQLVEGLSNAQEPKVGIISNQAACYMNWAFTILGVGTYILGIPSYNNLAYVTQLMNWYTNVQSVIASCGY